MVRPHLEYCVQVWAPRPRYGNWKVIMEVENCQRKFTKSIRGLEDLSYRDRLIKLGLTTLLKRRAQGDLIEFLRLKAVLLLMANICLEKVTLGDSFS